jgi:hypothetical protein
VSIANLGSSLGGLIFILVFLGIIIAFAFIFKEQPGRTLREIPAFVRLRHAIGLAVESGQRLHINLGGGGLQNLRGASGLIGLSVIQRIARTAAISDRPPIATSGEAALAILSQDVMKSSYREVQAESQYDPDSGQLTGLTPFSFAAGALPVIFDEKVSVNLLLGSYGSEVALLSDAAERTDSLTVGGSENLAAQAILFASAQEPLVGEELYVAGAYLQVNKMHLASLFAQDVLRWVIIAILIGGAFLKLVGVL